MNLTDIERKAFNELFRKYNILFAYLFGSRAEERAVKSSDFDFAVMFPKETVLSGLFDMRCKMISELTGILGKDVDVTALNDIDSVLLKFVVISKGMVIYEKDHGERLDFEVRVMNEYYDFKPFIEVYNKAYIKRSLGMGL